MKVRLLFTIVLGLALGVAAIAQDQDPSDNPDGGPPLGGHDVTGTVTGVGQGFVTVKTHAGETYTVEINQKTRLLRQGVQPTSNAGRREVGNPGLFVRPHDLHVGDMIAPMGEVDEDARTVNAMVITVIDPSHYKQMEAQTDTVRVTGEVKAVNGGKLTIEGSSDHAYHNFQTDRYTVYSKQNQRASLADIMVGDLVHVDGALKGGAYVATSVTTIPPRVHAAAAPRTAAPPAQPQ